MAKKKSPAAERNRPSDPKGLDFSAGRQTPVDVARGHAISFLNSHGTRELVESIVIAFVLAFLFKTFEAEAFVIPTGSMAETLQGRHKDYECPMCSYQYRASASDEVDQNTNTKWAEGYAASCPMCGYRAVLNDQWAGDAAEFDPHSFNSNQIRPTSPHGGEYEYVDEDRKNAKSYSGDRILVNKFAYEFDDPKRWDVIVFRYPLDANKNYIKRLIGLPGETLQIHRGDVFAKPIEPESGRAAGSAEMKIARKPPHKIRPMSHVVYDNNYVVEALTDRGWPTRWQTWSEDSQSPGWTTADNTRSFRTTGNVNCPTWIRYQHFPPALQDWEDVRDPTFMFSDVRPQLITDTYTYNSSAALGGQPFQPELTWPGVHWVGDLLLEADVEVHNNTGLLLLDLVRGGVHFNCSIDVATGVATLSIEDPLSDKTYPFQNAAGEDVDLPTAETSLKTPGKYNVALANVDRQVTLWIDGKLVKFPGFATGTATYDGVPTDIPRSSPTHQGDLAPAGIGADGVDVKVSNIRLSRDVYYIAGANRASLGNDIGMSDYISGPLSYLRQPGRQRSGDEILWDFYDRRKQFLSDPAQWPAAFSEMERSQFVLESFPNEPEKDQFFAAGDNSPASFDSRLWPAGNYFERDLLIGKAVFIYWPHSLDRPVPFFPNFKRMQFVR